MNARRSLWAFLAWATLPVLAQNVPASPAPAAAPANQPLAATSTAPHGIVLDVTVTDSSGKVVTGLPPQGFQVFDNKQERAIVSAGVVPADSKTDPTQILIILDAVNGSFQNVSLERIEVGKFLRLNGGKLAHPVSLLVLTDTDLKQIGTPTRDGNALGALLDQNPAILRSSTPAGGMYGAVDRLRKSLNALQELVAFESHRRGKKILIWISPGWPMLSGPGVRMGPKDQQSLFDTIVALSTSMREAHIALYSIDPLGVANSLTSRDYYRSFLNGVTHANDATGGNLGLQVLASQSGGLVLDGSNDLVAPLVTATADADGYYLLSFDPAIADHADEYHRLEVKASQPGLTIRTRSGYYAQPQKEGH